MQPSFSQKSYSAVVPEDAAVDTFVFNISAVDPDDGPGGEVFYDFLIEGDAIGLLKINTKTGEIRTKAPLTGKGRSEPYDMIIRAQDNGGRIAKQKSLFSDVTFVLFIGDVISNYAPFFITPKLGQIANITEVTITLRNLINSKKTTTKKELFQRDAIIKLSLINHLKIQNNNNGQVLTSHLVE